MKFTKEAGEKIAAALSERKAFRVCALCGQGPWSLADAIYFMPAQQDLPKITLGGRGMPLAAIVCMTCGNTLFINLLKLGLAEELAGIKPTTLLAD